MITQIIVACILSIPYVSFAAINDCSKFYGARNINAIPKKLTANKFSYEFAGIWDFSISDFKYKLPQDEVLIKDYPKSIRTKFEQVFNLSGDGRKTFVGAGFFVFVLKDTFVISDLATSNAWGYIHRDDLLPALEKALSNVNINNLVRMQFYHSHPGFKRNARTISGGDITEGLYWKELLQSRGIAVPIDIHALPFDLFQKYPQAPDFSPLLLRSTIPNS